MRVRELRGGWPAVVLLLLMLAPVWVACDSSSDSVSPEERTPSWDVGVGWEGRQGDVARPEDDARPNDEGATDERDGADGGEPAGEDEVFVQVGDQIQSLVDAHPEGTFFRIASGRHLAQRVVPKSGNRFIGEPGAILDGDFRARYAFEASDPDDPVHDVVIQGLLIERYDTPTSQGTVGGGGAEDWLIEGNEIRSSRGGGIGVNDGMIVRANYVHDNEQIGLIAGTPSSHILIEGNEISFNNSEGIYDMAWEAGGAKFANTTSLVARRNFVHDNGGAGLWTDGYNDDVLFEENVIAGNAGPGIHHEVSYSAEIVGNCVTDNALHYYQGGILIVSSSDVRVAGNTLSGNDGGVIVIQDERPPGPDGNQLRLRNVEVTRNVISYDAGITGLLWQAPFSPEGDVVSFEENEYRVPSRARAFSWLDERWTLDQWLEFDADDGTTGLSPGVECPVPGGNGDALA